jgi:hypothetical protein
VTRAIACLICLALVACAAGPSATDPANPSATKQIEQSGAGTSTSTTTPMAETAIDLLECDGVISPTGGRADEFGPSTGGATAEEAFAAFLDEPLFPIPLEGYEQLGVAGDRSVFAFHRDGEAKVVIVVSTRFGEMVRAPFTVEEVRMCEVAEFGAADFGEGRRVWVHNVTGDILTDIEGPGHCEWQSARMLHIEQDGSLVRQYVRDPENVFAGWPLLETYAEGVELPADATDSGYRSPTGLELWFTASDRAAYVVTPEGVERWPRAEEPIGCM